MAPQDARKIDHDHAELDTAVESEDSPLDRKQTAAIWYAFTALHAISAGALLQLTVTLCAGSPS